MIEQDQRQRLIRNRTRPMLEIKTFYTATSILAGVEAMHIIKKNRLIYEINLFKIKNNSFINYLD